MEQRLSFQQIVLEQLDIYVCVVGWGGPWGLPLTLGSQQTQKLIQIESSTEMLRLNCSNFRRKYKKVPFDTGLYKDFLSHIKQEP